MIIFIYSLMDKVMLNTERILLRERASVMIVLQKFGFSPLRSDFSAGHNIIGTSYADEDDDGQHRHNRMQG